MLKMRSSDIMLRMMFWYHVKNDALIPFYEKQKWDWKFEKHRWDRKSKKMGIYDWKSKKVGSEVL